MEYKNYENLIGDNIIAVRKEKGISQSKLASAVGITSSALSAYENNHKTPGLVTLANIAKVLNVPLDRLYFGDDSIADIVKAEDTGKRIANCVAYLLESGVAKQYPPNYKGSPYAGMIVLEAYSIQLERLARNLLELHNNRDTFTDPDAFRTQILDSVATEINNIMQDSERRKVEMQETARILNPKYR